MRIAIQTLGTRGDVQPYIALALALRSRGHDVQLAAPAQFEDLVRRNDVGFAALPGEFLALLDTPEGKDAVAGGKGFSAGFKLLKHIRPLMRTLIDREWEGVRGFAPDVIVYHPKSIAAPHMAEALDCVAILASPLPGFTPTSAFPTPMLPFRDLGPLNRISHSLAIRGAGLLFGRLLRDWRSGTLGLPPRGRGRQPKGTLYAYSRHVLPVPADWGADVLVSGYWFLDGAGWRPQPELAAFLAAGDKPVYVGFGSVPGLDPEGLTATIVDALRIAGKRGVLAVGGGAIGEAERPSSVHLLREEVPHAEFLPLMSSALHHGGAGTTGACVGAGIPMAICPFFGDQPFWARRVQELGIGPPPLDRKQLTPAGLAAAFTDLDRPDIRARASELGRLVRLENGADAAAEFIERIGGAAHGSPPGN